MQALIELIKEEKKHLQNRKFQGKTARDLGMSITKQRKITITMYDFAILLK